MWVLLYVIEVTAGGDVVQDVLAAGKDLEALMDEAEAHAAQIRARIEAFQARGEHFVAYVVQPDEGDAYEAHPYYSIEPVKEV